MIRSTRPRHAGPARSAALATLLIGAAVVAAPSPVDGTPSAQAGLRHAEVPQLAALDRAERTLQPGGDTLAWLARMVDPQVSAEERALRRGSLADDFTAAAKPIAGADDVARSLARTQRLRGTPLWAMAHAADATIPGAETFRPWMNELAADPDAVDARHRGAFLLAVAMIRQREGGDAKTPLDAVLARTDFPASERTAARAIETTLGPVPRAAMSEAMRTLLRGSERESAAVQLLVADIIARSLADPAEAWCALVEAREGDEALALAPLVLPRLRGVACDPATARPLHAIAALRTSSGERRAALEARLRGIADQRPPSPLLPLTLKELAWAAADAKRYDDAIALYERFARECRTNREAASMLGIAIFLRSTLREADDSERARAELAATLDEAIARHPQAREWIDWLVMASTLAAERRDAAGLRRCADAAPSDARMVPVFLRAAEGTLDDPALPEAERAAMAERYLARARGLEVEGAAPTPNAARRRLLDARRAALTGDLDAAIAGTTSLASDASAPDEVRRSALTDLVAALARTTSEVRPSAELVLLIADDPSSWWPAVAPSIRQWVQRVTAEPADAANLAEATRLLGVLGPLFLGPAARDGDPAWRCRLADAMLRAGAPTEVDRIFPAAEAHGTEALLLRAESQRRRGGEAALASAMRLFREVTDASKERSPEWWRAELGQLRVAAASASNVDAVRARIHWLRGLDHDLGGPASGPAIEELLRSLPDR